MKHCMASRTTAIIVNWNGSPYLERLLRSLKDASPAAIVAVDIASKDRSLEILANFTSVNVIRNEQNLGFGKAANQAILRTNTPYLMLLNADIELYPGAMDALEKFMDEN